MVETLDIVGQDGTTVRTVNNGTVRTTLNLFFFFGPVLWYGWLFSRG